MKPFLDLVAGAGCFLALVVLCGCLLPVFSGRSFGFADVVLCGIGLGAVTLFALCKEAFGG